MTCKDCIHYDKCYLIEHYGADESEVCKDFKNKADFVEVVRCINCKSRMFSDMYIECSKRLEIVRADDFCSYGERKDT